MSTFKEDDIVLTELKKMHGLEDWLADLAHNVDNSLDHRFTEHPESFSNGARCMLLKLREMVK